MIVDSHCHAWPRWPYPRAMGAAPIDEVHHGSATRLVAEMTAAGVDHAFVVAAQIGTPPTEDNDYVAALVAAEPQRFSMFFDLDSRWSSSYHDGRSTERLRTLEMPLLGVTHYLAKNPDGWWDSPDANALGEQLSRTGLVLSLHAPPAWHAEVDRWARRHPSVAVLLHHQGLADTDAQIEALGALAAVPEVRVKISGFSYIAGAETAPYTKVFDRLRRTIDIFGPERMLWGSDFPVAPEQGISYTMALEMVRDQLADLGAGALKAILGGNSSALRDRMTA